MQPLQLAVMQRPFQRDDRPGKERMRTLEQALEAAIAGAELEATVSEVIARELDSAKTERNRQWAAERGATVSAQANRQVSREVHNVAPQAFATWLAAHGMEPSQHIAAWFKVHGVAAGWQEAGTPAAPAAAAMIVAQDVTDWPSLVRYRQQFANLEPQKRPAWLASHVALLARQLQQAHAEGQQRGALGLLAKNLSGVTRQSLSDLLRRHGYSTTTGQQAHTSANPFGQIPRKQA
jgi:hypothetical protein